MNNQEEIKNYYFKEEDFNKMGYFSRTSRLDKEELESKNKIKTNGLMGKVEKEISKEESISGKYKLNKFCYVISPLVTSLVLMDSTIKSAKEDTLQTLVYSLLTIGSAFSAGYLFKK